MAMGESRGITVEDLVMLNQEIAALVRAGTPLERGLSSVGRDVRGRLGRIARSLAERMNQGNSLLQALELERDSIPPLYRAVVEAGVRSGRLPAALEGLTRYVRGYSEARAVVGLALWYPLLIIAVAYVLFIFLTVIVIPRFTMTLPGLGVELPAALVWLEWLGKNIDFWILAGPAALAMIGVLWIASGRAVRFGGWAWGLAKLIPGMSRLISDYETANFSELLALLIEHQMAFAPALRLAGEATGNLRIAQATLGIAQDLERGRTVAEATAQSHATALQPMIRWALATATAPGALDERLRGLSVHYRNRAQYRAENLRIWLPSLLLVTLGGGAALLYGLSLMVPLASLLTNLSQAR